MGKEILTLGDIEVEIHKFHRYKSPILLKDIDIGKVLVFNKIFYGEKKNIDTLLNTCMMIIK